MSTRRVQIPRWCLGRLSGWRANTRGDLELSKVSGADKTYIPLNKLISIWVLYIIWAYVMPKSKLTLCPYRLFSGHKCPLCDTTTSIQQLLHRNSSLKNTKTSAILVLLIGLGLIFKQFYRISLSFFT